jgi:hypothetical protein
MQPKFIELPEKKVVGLGTKFISILSSDKNNSGPLPALWQNFIKQPDKIPHKTNIYFGVVETPPTWSCTITASVTIRINPSSTSCCRSNRSTQARRSLLHIRLHLALMRALSPGFTW